MPIFTSLIFSAKLLALLANAGAICEASSSAEVEAMREDEGMDECVFLRICLLADSKLVN